MENPQFLNIPHSKKIIAASVVAFLIMAFGCSFYGGIKGTVLDNATGKPIEGAVVVAQWTKARGIPGLQYDNLHKITETLTNKDGKFSLSGTTGLLLNQPEMIIYKEGYIPWRNDMVFPEGRDMNSNKKNEWNNRRTYRLDKFTGTGKDISWLSTFTSYGFMIEGLGKTPKFDEHITKLQMAEYEEIQKQKSNSKR